MVDRDESKVRTFTGNEAKQKVSRCSADRARIECSSNSSSSIPHSPTQLVPFFYILFFTFYSLQPIIIPILYSLLLLLALYIQYIYIHRYVVFPLYTALYNVNRCCCTVQKVYNAQLYIILCLGTYLHTYIRVLRHDRRQVQIYRSHCGGSIDRWPIVIAKSQRYIQDDNYHSYPVAQFC